MEFNAYISILLLFELFWIVNSAIWRDKWGNAYEEIGCTPGSSTITLQIGVVSTNHHGDDEYLHVLKRADDVLSQDHIGNLIHGVMSKKFFTCYTFNLSEILVPAEYSQYVTETAYNWFMDGKKLESFHFLIGSFVKSVAVMTSAANLPYYVITPLPTSGKEQHFEFERKAGLLKGPILNMQPFYSSTVALTISDYVRATKRNRILLLYDIAYMTDTAAIDNQLHGGNIEFTLHFALRKPMYDVRYNHVPGTHHESVQEIAYTIFMHDINTVIFFFHAKNRWSNYERLVHEIETDEKHITWICGTFMDFAEKPMTYGMALKLFTPLIMLPSTMSQKRLYKPLKQSAVDMYLLHFGAMLRMQLKTFDLEKFDTLRFYEKMKSAHLDYVTNGMVMCNRSNPTGKMTMFKLSMHVEYDTFGIRRNAYITIRDYDDLTRVRYWYANGPTPETRITPRKNICNISYTLPPTKVLVVIDEPFVYMLDDEFGRLKGNDRFSGIFVEYFELVAEHVRKNYGLKFHYELVHKPGLDYGRYENGTWNGAVGEILSGRYEIVLAAISKTYSRMEVISFTPGIVSDGLTFIYRPHHEATNFYYSFLKPLGYFAWLVVISGIALTAFTLRIFYKLNPTHEEIDAEHHFTMRYCLWYGYTTSLRLGAPMTPTTVPMRLFTFFVMFFAMVVISSYTGNMASFLTEETFLDQLDNLSQLATQTKFAYGFEVGGTDDMFFANSKDPAYSKMNAHMRKHNTTVESIEAGIDKAMNEDYVFITQSIGVNYFKALKKYCKLKMGEGRISIHEIAIPMAKDSPYVKPLSDAVREIRGSHQSRDIINYWLHGKDPCLKTENVLPKQISYANFSGGFIMLGIGVGISFLASVIKRVLIRFNLCSRIIHPKPERNPPGKAPSIRRNQVGDAIEVRLPTTTQPGLTGRLESVTKF
ncbi:glutamate receptor ionotropic, kainate 2-like [Tubulanus polymorphus]|uniref:glutamate receptor ionotropic, kainate 2-like n=1 Tax=Tubulanus polymorphus TaxID=672921 RepID=UPI003DA2D05A